MRTATTAAYSANMVPKNQSPQERALWENDVHNPHLPRTSRAHLEDMKLSSFLACQAAGIKPEDMHEPAVAEEYRAWLEKQRK